MIAREECLVAKGNIDMIPTVVATQRLTMQLNLEDAPLNRLEPVEPVEPVVGQMSTWSHFLTDLRLAFCEGASREISNFVA